MALQFKEDVDDFILSCLTSTPDERRELQNGIERRKESLKKGAFLCLKINERLKTNELEFVPTVDRLYSDDAFSFEAMRLGRNRTNSSDRSVNVLIRIQPSRFDDDVQPSLFNVNAVFDVGNNKKKSILLDDVGEGVLEGLQPNYVCRLDSLETSFSTEEEGVISTESLPYANPCGDQKFVEQWVASYNAKAHLAADDHSESKLKKLAFNYGGSFVSAIIQPQPPTNDEKPCSLIQLFTEDESILGKSCYLIFKDGRRAGFGGFTFEKRDKFYKASAEVEIKCLNEVVIVDVSKGNESSL